MTPDPRSDIPPDAVQTVVMRVQIPAYTDAWMKGDRFGNVLKITKAKTSSQTDMNIIDTRARILTSQRWKTEIEIAHVLMDKSNKVLRVVLADCEVVS
jgi:hypothetical protein